MTDLTTRAAAEWGAEAQMSPLESLMWRTELNPRLRSTGMLLEVLDGPPERERLITAHEWGHLVQTELGIMSASYRSIDIELQADCFAGAWAKHADQAGELEAGDLQEGARALYNAGDPANVPWFSRQAHGTPQQREDSFNNGYAQGVQGCPIAGHPPGLTQGSK